MGGHLDLLKYLIDERGANAYFRTTREWKTSQHINRTGQSLLHVASREEHNNVVKYLVEQCDVDASSSTECGVTPFHLACINYFIAEANGSPHHSDKYGKTSLHYACWGAHLAVVKFLIEDLKCEPESMDGDGLLPLHNASASGNFDVVNIL